jgi:hypothetical protein
VHTARRCLRHDLLRLIYGSAAVPQPCLSGIRPRATCCLRPFAPKALRVRSAVAATPLVWAGDCGTSAGRRSMKSWSSFIGRLAVRENAPDPARRSARRCQPGNTLGIREHSSLRCRRGVPCGCGPSTNEAEPDAALASDPATSTSLAAATLDRCAAPPHRVHPAIVTEFLSAAVAVDPLRLQVSP